MSGFRSRRLTATGFLFAAALTVGFSQEKNFDQDRALEIIRTLSSDHFQGRQTGTKGGRQAEAWMAEQIEKLGLEPAGTDGYFQPFTLMRSQEKSARIMLLDSPFGKIDFVYGDDFTLVANSGSGNVEGEAVIVGHGISEPDKGWDDYGNADVKGKVVVIFRGEPPIKMDWNKENSRNYTVDQAYSRGAAAILYLQDARPIQGGAIQIKSYHEDLPSLYVRERVVDLLLEDTGWKVETYRDRLKKEPLVIDTGKRLAISTKVATDTQAVGRNVMGLVRGTDTLLSKEIIVVGAHLDHVGVNGRGVVYNGADDNASGSAVVFELARCVAQNPALKRSILFQWYGAEEAGLFGSKYWVEHPTVELGNVVGMLNFDMVGRGDGTVGAGGGEFYPEVWENFVAELDSSLKDKLTEHRSWQGGSDQTSFLNKDVPAFPFYTKGDHPFYHVLDDDANWIQPEALESVGRIAQSWLQTLANWQESLADSLSHERMLWAHNYQIRERYIGNINPAELVTTISADRNTPCPLQWLWYQPDDSAKGLDHIVRWADNWRIVDSEKKNVQWAGNLKDAKDAIGDRKTAVMLAITDETVLPDIQALRVLRNQGVRLIRLTDPWRWMTPSTSEIDTELIAEVTRGKWLIVAPVQEDSIFVRWADKFRSSIILWGNPETYAAMDTTTLDSLTSWSSLVVVTWTPPSNSALVRNQLRWMPAEKTHLNLDDGLDSVLRQDPQWVLRRIRDFGELPDSTWSWEKVLGGNLVEGSHK